MASQSQSESSAASALIAIAEQYISVFAALDGSVIAPIQAEGYTQTFAPSSIEGLPSLSRDEFTAHLANMRQLMRSFPVYAKEIWPNPSLNQVTIWADSKTIFHDYVIKDDSPDEWTYRGEYIFILTLDSSGEKIKRVLEFLDSKGTDQLRAMMAKAKKRKEEIDATA